MHSGHSHLLEILSRQMIGAFQLDRHRDYISGIPAMKSGRRQLLANLSITGAYKIQMTLRSLQIAEASTCFLCRKASCSTWHPARQMPPTLHLKNFPYRKFSTFMSLSPDTTQVLQKVQTAGSKHKWRGEGADARQCTRVDNTEVKGAASGNADRFISEQLRWGQQRRTVGLLSPLDIHFTGTHLFLIALAPSRATRPNLKSRI